MKRHSVIFELHVVDINLMLCHIAVDIRWGCFSEHGGNDAMHFVRIKASDRVSWIELVYKSNVAALNLCTDLMFLNSICILIQCFWFCSVYQFNVSQIQLVCKCYIPDLNLHTNCMFFFLFTARQSIHGTHTTDKLIRSKRWGIPHSWSNVKGASTKRKKRSYSQYWKKRYISFRYQIDFDWNWFCCQIKLAVTSLAADDSSSAATGNDHADFLYSLGQWAVVKSTIVESQKRRQMAPICNQNDHHRTWFPC